MVTIALAVLIVIAHPDDETMFGGLIHALTHKLNSTVDLVCITNGEGGFQHSAPSESLYGNLELSKESIGRIHLPRIRKQELFASGRIIGIRKYFFYDQFDLKYDRNVDNVFSEQWNTELVIQLLEQTIKTGNGAYGYDLIIVIHPNTQSHGHHTASALLTLKTIQTLQEKKLPNIKIPLVISGSEFILTDSPIYPLDSIADVLSTNPNEFQFNRKWKLSKSSDTPDYRMIVIWMASEHKSQGGLISSIAKTYEEKNEQYFYFSLNDKLDNETNIVYIRNIFQMLHSIHEY